MFSPDGENRDGQEGQAFAELAVVVTVLLIITLSVFDLGRGLHAYMSVIHGARDGARVAMTAGTTDAQIQAAAETAASPIDPTVTISRGTSTVSVTVVYDYDPITPFLELIGSGGSLRISSTMVSR